MMGCDRCEALRAITLQPAFWAGNHTGEVVVVVEQQFSVFCIFYSTYKATMPALLQLCQPEEIIIIQVPGERVLGENRQERKRAT